MLCEAEHPLVRFGEAESFFLRVMHIPDASVALHALLLERSAQPKLQELSTAFEQIVRSSQQIYDSSALITLLHTVLVIGNTLNKSVEVAFHPESLKNLEVNLTLTLKIREVTGMRHVICYTR